MYSEDCLLHPFNRTKLNFNFSELNTLTQNFDLRIFSSDKLYDVAPIVLDDPSGQITRLEHPLRTAIIDTDGAKFFIRQVVIVVP